MFPYESPPSNSCSLGCCWKLPFCYFVSLWVDLSNAAFWNWFWQPSFLLPYKVTSWISMVWDVVDSHHICYSVSIWINFWNLKVLIYWWCGNLFFSYELTWPPNNVVQVEKLSKSKSHSTSGWTSGWRRLSSHMKPPNLFNHSKSDFEYPHKDDESIAPTHDSTPSHDQSTPTSATEQRRRSHSITSTSSVQRWRNSIS